MTFSIPFLDFGGDGPRLHFAHANGYPPGSYRLFLQALRPYFHVLSMQQRPLWPHSHPTEMSSWEIIADDLIAFLEQQGGQAIIGVGHSLGAVATMLAARKRPSLFRALVLIEPVFLPPHYLEMAAANPDGAYALPLVQNARRRRQQWDNRQSAFDRFRAKAVFDRWTDEALWDYVNAGTIATEDETVILAFPREWEAHIYAHPPLMVWQEIGQVTPPTLAIRATNSDTLFPSAWQLWQEKQPGATFVEIPETGHMLTMERPSFLAEVINNYLRYRLSDNVLVSGVEASAGSEPKCFSEHL